jgi:hypothetical protein
MKRRLSWRVPRPRAEQLWTATYILMGLRYDLALAENLLQGVLDMEESVTYQAIIAKGEKKGILEGARKILLRLGQLQFAKAAPAWARAALEKVGSLDELENISTRLMTVRSWDELLPSARKRSRRSTSDF